MSQNNGAKFEILRIVKVLPTDADASDEIDRAYNEWLSGMSDQRIVKAGSVLAMGWAYYREREYIIRFKVDLPIFAIVKSLRDKTDKSVYNTHFFRGIISSLVEHQLAEEVVVDIELELGRVEEGMIGDYPPEWPLVKDDIMV